MYTSKKSNPDEYLNLKKIKPLINFEQFKLWQESRRKEDMWVEYKRLYKEAKSTVNKTKLIRYEKSEKKEGKKKVYRLAKIRKK